MAAAAARAGAGAGRGAVPASRWFARLPSLLLASLALAAVAGVGVLQVLQSSRAAAAGYEIRKLEQQRDRLSAEVRLLEVEVANMADSERIGQQAVARLGMRAPERSVRVAVGVPAPRGMPLPERYVPAVEVVAPLDRPWWAAILESLPGAR